MSRGGLYTGFEHYRVPDEDEMKHALLNGIIAVDTNVLLHLYRYNANAANDVMRVLSTLADRLFVPHQVKREFWRLHDNVVGNVGTAAKEATAHLVKNQRSTKDALQNLAKRVALPDPDCRDLTDRVDGLYQELVTRIAEMPAPISERDGDAKLLERIERLLDGAVGPAYGKTEESKAIAEGERRAKDGRPPGYKDRAKSNSDLPEGAAGDYLVWRQLLDEGERCRRDLVFVTGDQKEDWWERGKGGVVGARRELIEEYLLCTGKRVVFMEPLMLLNFASAFDGLEVSDESAQDIQRVQGELPSYFRAADEALGSPRADEIRMLIDGAIRDAQLPGDDDSDPAEILENALAGTGLDLRFRPHQSGIAIVVDGQRLGASGFGPDYSGPALLRRLNER